MTREEFNQLLTILKSLPAESEHIARNKSWRSLKMIFHKDQNYLIYDEKQDDCGDYIFIGNYDNQKESPTEMSYPLKEGYFVPHSTQGPAFLFCPNNSSQEVMCKFLIKGNLLETKDFESHQNKIILKQKITSIE